MRIIAGSLGGRQFDSPRGHRTHPMSDKVRGAIFNMLGDIEGLTVLDAFAGSGGLVFEAISRGAKSAMAIDIDRDAAETIVKNIGTLGLKDKVKAIRANVSSWSKNNPATQFDIVLCDPPYDQLQTGLLQKLVKHVQQKGLMVLSWPGGVTVPELVGTKMAANKSYGDAQLVFYRRIS